MQQDYQRSFAGFHIVHANAVEFGEAVIVVGGAYRQHSRRCKAEARQRHRSQQGHIGSQKRSSFHAHDLLSECRWLFHGRKACGTSVNAAFLANPVLAPLLSRPERAAHHGIFGNKCHYRCAASALLSASIVQRSSPLEVTFVAKVLSSGQRKRKYQAGIGKQAAGARPVDNVRSVLNQHCASISLWSHPMNS